MGAAPDENPTGATDAEADPPAPSEHVALDSGNPARGTGDARTRFRQHLIEAAFVALGIALGTTLLVEYLAAEWVVRWVEGWLFRSAEKPVVVEPILLIAEMLGPVALVVWLVSRFWDDAMGLIDRVRPRRRSARRHTHDGQERCDQN